MHLRSNCRFLTLLGLLGILTCTALGQGRDLKFKERPEVAALLTQASAAARLFHWDEAINLCEAAAKKSQELKDLYGYALSLKEEGSDHYGVGNLLKAKECFSLAQEAYAKAGDEYDELGMMGNVAIILDNTGHHDESKPIYERLLRHYRGAKDGPGTARMLINLAILYSNTGDYAQVSAFSSEALKLTRALGDKSLECSSLGLLAEAESATSNFKAATAAYQEMEVIARGGGFKRQEATALISLSEIYRQQGEGLKALDLVRQGLKIREDMKDLRFQSKALTSMGIVYDTLGQSRLAVESLTKAVAISNQIGDRPDESMALVNLGVVLDQAHRYSEAAPVLIKALELARSVGDKSGIGSSLGTLGGIEREQHHYKTAEKYLQEATRAFHELGYEENEASCIDELASVCLYQGKYAEALRGYQKAIVIYRKLGSRLFAANTLGNIGLAQYRQGKLADAEATFRKCTAEYEDVRAGLGASPEGKAEFSGRRFEIYQTYINILVKRGRIGEAFSMVQQTKSRSLIDLLNGGNLSMQKEMTESEKSEEHALRSVADQINAQMVKEGAQNEIGAKNRYASLKRELQTAENKLSAFTAQLFVSHPNLARRRSAGTVTLAQIAAQIPANTALLEYVSGQKPLVFVVSSRKGKASVTATAISLSGEKLEKQCSELRDALSNPTKPYIEASAILYKALIQPVAAQIKGKTRLIICPDGAMWDVPFAALCLPGSPNSTFLAEHFEIDYAYSATIEQSELRPRAKTAAVKSLLILANPDFGGASRFGDSALIPGQRPIEPPSRPIEPPSRPIEPPSRPIEPPSRDLGEGIRAGIVELPGTQLEAENLAHLYPKAKVLTRKQAQESAFVSEASQYQYLHIASHAFFNDASPMLSSVILATPSTDQYHGYLTAREIFDLKLNADLVVLSACNTARGEKRSGDGLIGLSYALFAAGVPAQVVSQWSVDDRATATLMTRFYSNMKRGQPKGASLRNATLTFLNPKMPGNLVKWRHPYYWAPFILLGDWK